MACPRMGGGGGGATHGKFDIFRFQMSISLPWVSILSQIPTPGAN